MREHQQREEDENPQQGGTQETNTRDGGQEEEQADDSQERQERESEERTRQRIRQYPESPRRRRTDPDAAAYGGWDVIDNLSVAQCAVRPPGMQTIEFIPNSLQEEWTEAWI